MIREVSSEAFFEAKYARTGDPWNFATDEYEQSRYAATLASLQGRSFQNAFEPGCSIGVLTEHLAPLCDHLEASDISKTAVAQARERCRHLSNVEINQASLPEGIPAGPLDLAVFSEIGYYFNEAELAQVAETLVSRLASGGILLAVHWLGYSPDHQLSGDQVHGILARVPGLQNTRSERFTGFRLDQWTKS